jgi:predicted Zn-dependent protease
MSCGVLPFHQFGARIRQAPDMKTFAIFNVLRRVAQKAAIGLVGAVFAIAASAPAFAQNMATIRDAEIETLVRDYARPILKAAGLSKSGVEIVLINDPSFNAFVAGRRIFINTGALLQSETPNQIIGVIAHEAGHLAGGHQERLREQIARAQTMAVVAMALGVGAIAAGAATDQRGLAQAGGGIMAGSGEFAQRGLMGYKRSEETTADRSAVTYLEATGQSTKGMLETFERFQDALALSGTRIDPYRVSHPAPRDRIANLEDLAKKSRYYDKKDPEALQLRHDMMRAKIAAYTQGQTATARLFRKDPTGLPAKYGDAMTTYLTGNLASALKKIDALVKAQPQNPYFQELRGDALMKANKPKQAAEAYGKAVKLDPSRSGMLRVGLGQALIASGDPASLKRAVSEINEGLERDRENAMAYRYLAQAYGQLGDIAEADLATAEGNFYSGNYQDAKIFAMRAQTRMKVGSPGWVRAQDIVTFKVPKKKRG